MWPTIKILVKLDASKIQIWCSDNSICEAGRSENCLAIWAQTAVSNTHCSLVTLRTPEAGKWLRNLLTINHNPGFSLNTLSPQTWLAETWTTRGIPNCRHCHRLPVPGGCQVNARPESGGRGLWLSSWHLPRHLGPAAGEGNHSQEWWWELDRYSPAAASSPSHQPHIKWFLIAPTTFNISTSCSAIQSLQNSRTESTCNFILHTLKLTPCWW